MKRTNNAIAVNMKNEEGNNCAQSSTLSLLTGAAELKRIHGRVVAGATVLP